jgi:hypothetical protein
MIRARWWREVETALAALPSTERLMDGPGQPDQDWRPRVRASLESRVAYPTPEQWSAFDAQMEERLRQERLADEARKATEQTRGKQQQQEELLQREEEVGLQKEPTWQDLVERIQQMNENAARAVKEMTRRMQGLRILKTDDRVTEKETLQDRGGSESAPAGPETDEQRPGARKRVTRSPRRVRI